MPKACPYAIIHIGNPLQGFAFGYWKERRKSMREVPSSRLNFLRRR